MSTHPTRTLKQRWEDVLKHVRAHGGEVTHFLDLLNEEAHDKIFWDKENHNNAPTGTVCMFGYTGENTAAFTHPDYTNGGLELYPAVNFDNFDQMVRLIEEEEWHSLMSYCMGDTEKSTPIDIVDKWSVEALEWATHKADIYWNLLVCNYPFDDVNEDLKPNPSLFKNESTMPMSYAEAFPNIYASKMKQLALEKQKTRQKKQEEVTAPVQESPQFRLTDYGPESDDDNYICITTCTKGLTRIAATLSPSKKRIYDESEKTRVEKIGCFKKARLTGRVEWKTYTMEYVNHAHDIDRRFQLMDLLAQVPSE
jgi:hypothetical protein